MAIGITTPFTVRKARKTINARNPAPSGMIRTRSESSREIVFTSVCRVPAIQVSRSPRSSTSAVSMRSWEFERTRYWHKLAAVLETNHALLCPTMAVPAPPNSLHDEEYEHVDEDGKLHTLDMTSVFNYFAQCPALSVPSGFADGLPTAAQIVVRKWDDPLALRIGAAVEAALPWAERRPPL